MSRSALSARVREMRALGIVEHDPKTGRILLGPAPAEAKRGEPAPDPIDEGPTEKDLFGASTPVVMPATLGVPMFGSKRNGAKAD